MEFKFTDEQAMIADTARDFFVEHATSERTRAAMADGRGIDLVLWQDFTRELGLAGVALPERFGGVGLGMIELAIVAAAGGAQVAALPLIASLALAAPAILHGGSDMQRAEWLPRLASGETMATLVALEGGSGGAICAGRVSGRGARVPHGASADLFVIDNGEDLALVQADDPGVTITPLPTMDATRPLVEMRFDHAVANPLEDAAAARAAAHRTGWIALAADALGGAQACLDRTVAYARERHQFGRSIGSFQAVKHQLADMMVEIEQARSAVYWAACAADEETADAMLAAHAAKAFATDTYAMCAGKMIQLHGGIGFTWEHDAHLFFKRAQANRTLLGTPHWHREQIARLIGLDIAA